MLTAEILVKNNFKKSILIAEMLVEKPFQGRHILTAEILVKNNFKKSILIAEMLAKSHFKGETF